MTEKKLAAVQAASLPIKTGSGYPVRRLTNLAKSGRDKCWATSSV